MTDRLPDETAHQPRWVYPTLLVLIASGLGLRVLWPTTTVFCEDQARACALAEDISNGRFPTGGLVNSGKFRNPPGYVYLLGGAWAVRPGPGTLLAVTMGANLLAWAVAVWLTAKWAGRAVAWWAGALLATAPWAIHYSRWIWAQDLLFPAAVLVYLLLWLWLERGRSWAAGAAVLALGLLVQIHLAGVVLVVAVGLVLLWMRPRVPWRWVLPAAAVAGASFLPWLLGGNLARPAGNRTGYEHVWRVVPAAMMSVSGAFWQLEFREGFGRFAASLGWRRWLYEAANIASILLLTAAMVAAGVRLVRLRRQGPDVRRQGLAAVGALAVALVLAFMLLGIRTSPTYLPMGYPLPFVLMAAWWVRLLGRCRSRFRRGLLTGLLPAVMLLHCGFFAEQLAYVRRNGGVPGSPLGRSYRAMRSDLASLPGRVPDGAVWLRYEGQSPIQGESTAYLLRRMDWQAGPGVSLLSVRLQAGPGGSLIHLQDIQEPPAAGQSASDSEVYLISPWSGPMQREGRILRRPVDGQTALDSCEPTGR